MSDLSKFFYLSYQSAGKGYPVDQRAKVFKQLKNEQDVTLQNEIVAQISQIVEGDTDGFFKNAADLIINKPIKREKRFLFKLAENLLRIGQKNRT